MAFSFPSEMEAKSAMEKELQTLKEEVKWVREDGVPPLLARCGPRHLLRIHAEELDREELICNLVTVEMGRDALREENKKLKEDNKRLSIYLAEIGEDCDCRDEGGRATEFKYAEWFNKITNNEFL
jgi:hypothetical protein